MESIKIVISLIHKKKQLTNIDFFCLGFGSIVGIGWVVSLNHWMTNSGGPLPAAVGFLLSFLMVGPVALCYCELGAMMPVAGGGTAYAFRAFGEKTSFLSGWLSLGGFATILPWEAIYVTNVLSYLIPGITMGGPIYEVLGSPVYPGTIVLGVICSVGLFLLNLSGPKSSARFQYISCVFLISTSVIAMIFACIGGDMQNLTPVYENVTGTTNHCSFFGGAFSIIASSAFFLCGFETIPQAIEDGGKNFARIGKMIVFSVGGACLFYSVILTTFGMGIPWKIFIFLDTPAGANLFLAMYDGGIGYIPYILVTLGAICGLLTTWNGFLVATPRLLMGMARARMIPNTIAAQNSRGIPTKGLVLCFVFSLMGPFLGIGFVDHLASFSGVCFMLSWIITCASLIKLRHTEPNSNRPYRLPKGKQIAIFAILFTGISFIMTFIPGTPCYIGLLPCILFFLWIFIGFAIFILNTGNRNAMSIEERRGCMLEKPKNRDEHCGDV